LNSETRIVEPATRSVEKLNAFLRSKKCPEYAEFFKAEGEKLGIKWDVVIFQACLETGFWRFGGDVKPEQNNFFGIGATGGGVPGDTFPTPQIGIAAQMQNMALRAGVKVPLADVIANHCRRNYGIISRRNTPRWEQLAGTYASDVKYWEKIKAIAAEFDKFAVERPEPKADAPARKIRILLDPGHSEQKVGARGNDPKVEEEDLNRLEAETIKANLGAHVEADIWDPLVDDLVAIGKKAADYDAFISCHKNKYAGNEDPGSELFICLGDTKSRAFADAILGAICAALGTKYRGVKEKNFTVIHTARQYCRGPVVLVESFFVNKYTKTEAEVLARKSGVAIAGAINTFFKGE
jgi:N-acetylmuramoyl-L-alanine amidase